MYKQVKFRLLGEDESSGGILNTDTNEVICGCCGEVFERKYIEFLKPYDEWASISEDILGDD